jgi:AbrB family looped-hinge helix DNA binding protein
MPTRTAQADSSARTGALSRIGQRRQVVIPKEVFDALALAEGDFTEVTAENSRVAMKPRKPWNSLRQGRPGHGPRSSMTWACELTEDAERDLRGLPKGIQKPGIIY